MSGEGERVRKDLAADGSWKEYFMAGGQVTSELSSSGTWSDYIYAGGEKMTRVDSLAGSVTGSHYYVADPLGTAQLEFSGSGQQVWQGDFDPWGNESDNNATTNNYKFTGKERDAESGNDYFGARYYGSSMGRFMSPDWSAKEDPVPYANLGNPQSLNLYSYVGNNPLRRVDGDGHLGVDKTVAWDANLCAEIDCPGAARAHQKKVDAQIAKLEKQQAALPRVVVAADAPGPPVPTGVNVSRVVTYRPHSVNSDGSLGDPVGGDINLRETVLGATPGSHPSTCTPHCEEHARSFDDQQAAGNGQYLDVRRVWTYQRRDVPVWDPVQKSPASAEILHIQYGDDPKKYFRMEYVHP